MLLWSWRDTGEKSWLREKYFHPRTCWRSDWPAREIHGRRTATSKDPRKNRGYASQKRLKSGPNRQVKSINDFAAWATQTKESGPKLYNSITTRPKMATLARLRTGHCSLNQYLYRMGIEESPRCSQCTNGGIEDVEHFLIRCTKFDQQRAELIKKVGIGGMEAEKLLGDPDFTKHTLEFVENTGRFSF